MPFFDTDRDDGAGRDRGLPGGEPPPVPPTGSPYDTLLGAVDEVIGEWRVLVTREPWSALSPSRLVDSFAEILPKMLRLARSGATHIDDGLRELIADAHGHFRRADGVPLTSVTEEWAYLKRACRFVLDAHGINNGEADRAMERLDILVDDAVGYTLRGYYRPELDSLRGRGLERREISDRRRGTPNRRGRGES
ncbi:MAG TPA: hypothetical protein VJ650_01870 [Gemmatimonadaceae bacterium]|nr:hypothetical protein [Gemmatimonadaceae bacterium]